MHTWSLTRSKKLGTKAMGVRKEGCTQRIVKHRFTSRIRSSNALLAGKSGGHKAVVSASHTDASAKDEGERAVGDIKKEVLHPVWKYHDNSAEESTPVTSYEPPKTRQHVSQVSAYHGDNADECAAVISSESSTMVKHANEVSTGSESGEVEDKNWNDPRWTERGSAPSRGYSGYDRGDSADGLFSGGGSRQVPAGLIERARGGDDGDGEGEKRPGTGGNGGNGGDNNRLPPILSRGEALNENDLPGPSALGLWQRKENADRAIARAILSQCNEKQRDCLRTLLGSSETSDLSSADTELQYLQNKVKRWNFEVASAANPVLAGDLPSQSEDGPYERTMAKHLLVYGDGFLHAKRELETELGEAFALPKLTLHWLNYGEGEEQGQLLSERRGWYLFGDIIGI